MNLYCSIRNDKNNKFVVIKVIKLSLETTIAAEQTLIYNITNMTLSEMTSRDYQSFNKSYAVFSWTITEFFYQIAEVLSDVNQLILRNNDSLLGYEYKFASNSYNITLAGSCFNKLYLS